MSDLPQVVEADIDPALHDAFREMLLKVPEQKNIGTLVAYVWEAAVRAAVAQERERCAQLCESEAGYWEDVARRESSLDLVRLQSMTKGALTCAAAIRAANPPSVVAAHAAPPSQLLTDARRAVAAWDNSPLPKSHDGMMQESMEALREAVAEHRRPQ